MHSTGENDVIVDFICQRLFEEERDCYVEEETDRDGNVIYSPPPLQKFGCLSLSDVIGKKS